MATAEEYAGWIVKNQDKKGTPEFETVANAYKIARGQDASASAPTPTRTLGTTVADIPGQDGLPVQPRQERKAGLKDILGAQNDIVRSILQNAAALGVSGPQALAEAGGRKLMGKEANLGPRFQELMQMRGYESQNPVTQNFYKALEELNRQVLTPLGPAGVVGMGAMTGIPAQVAPKAARAGEAIGEAAKAAGAGAKERIGTVTGRTAKEAQEALRTGILGETEAAKELAGRTAQALERAPGAAAEREIAGTRATVKSQLTGKAEEAARVGERQLGALAPRVYGEEEVGKLIQQRGQSTIGGLKQEAQQVIEDIKDPAFLKARERAAAGETLATNEQSKPIIDEAIAMLEQQVADVPEGMAGPLQQRIKALRGGEGRALTEEEARVERLRASIEGREPVLTAPPEGLTLQQAEYLRRFGNDPILRRNEGFGALDSQRMKDMAKKVEEAMVAYEPDVRKYLDEYRKVKEREDIALGGTYGESAIKSIAGEGAEEILGKTPTEVARYYLKGDEASAKKLINLAGGRSPELDEAVRGYLRGQIEGMSADQAQKFAAKNAGLFEAFPEVKPAIEGIVDAKTQGEKYTGMASKQLKRAEQAAGEVKAAEKGARSEAAKQRDLERALNLRVTEIGESSPQNAPKVARTAAKQLADQGLITNEKYGDILRAIDRVEKTQGRTERAQNALKYLMYGALGMAGAGTVLRNL